MDQKIEQVRVAELTVHPLASRLPMLAPDNPRMRELVNGIASTGMLSPIVIDPDRRVIVGRHRLAAAQELGLETVPAATVEATESVISEIIIQENLARQEMTQSKRALMIVAFHDDFIKDRKARRTSNLQRGKSSEVNFSTLDDSDIPENPFAGMQYCGDVHSKKWASIPLTMKQLSKAYGVNYDYLVWAAHLWDEKDGDAAPLIAKIWNGEISLGHAYAGLIGGKAPQKRKKPESKFIEWRRQSTIRIDGLFEYKEKNPDLFDKFRDDLLKMHRDLSILLDLSSKPRIGK